MNLIRKRPLKAALFLLIGSLGFYSCEKPEQSIGLEVQPEDELLNLNVTDTLTLEASTVNEDSLRTDELSVSLAGNYSDPIFGQVNTIFTSQLRLPTNNVDFGDPANLVLDSVVFSLVYEGDVYGNLNDQTWSVKEVVEQLYVDSTYYSNRAFLLGDELVDPMFASQAIQPETWVQTEGDSLVPQLRLRLTNSFGQRILNASGTTELSNNQEFLQFFNGIQLSSETPGAGAIRFDALNVESKVTLFYRDVVEEDTTAFNLNINADCARITSFMHDYSGTALAGVEDNPVDGSVSCFIQAGGGVKTRVRVPNLLELNIEEDRTINSAFLYLPVGNNDTDTYEPQPSLFALTVNSSGDNVGIPDQLLGPSHIDGIYDEEESRYRFNITRYVQSILEGLLDNNSLFIVSNSAGVTVRRVQLNGPNAFPENPDQNMRLEITYSN